MRPLRLLLALSTSLLAVTLLLYVTLGTGQDERLEGASASATRHHGRFKPLVAFTSPSSLFPPSAIISLTDDNSTFFLARPAAFGPPLPKDGLSSPLWIGSGFGDEMMGNGELGCSDIPDWEDSGDRLLSGPKPTAYARSQANGPLDEKKNAPRRRILGREVTDASKSSTPKDGTDDHLHQPPQDSRKAAQYKGQILGHADIQSLQESAEITGKVVLLRRGGCGFLAKVEWAQKRGGVAVIIGDDVRGGGLIRMYAKGDTSNVTIPSLFTSHTTAHLLSSLLPSDRTSGDFPPAGTTRLTSSDDKKDAKEMKKTSKQGEFTPSKSTAMSTPTSKAGKQETEMASKSTLTGVKEQGWFHSLLVALGLGSDDQPPVAGSRRLPGSGDLDWVQTEDWDDDEKPIKTRIAAAVSTSTAVPDGFVIGKQDWRDAALLPTPSSTNRVQSKTSPMSTSTTKGGSVLPGSGEYTYTSPSHDRKTWWSGWFGSKKVTSMNPGPGHANIRSVTSITRANIKQVETSFNEPEQHEGLWVTLTPTSVSTSPFFDTLLVLVVSPLVTLTVVYALLLLRSRIRRRRWRAPKSVVERLPVRTYHTISDSSSSPSTSSETATPTTPLLQRSPTQPTSSLPRRRSQTESNLPTTSSSVQHGPRTREEEKRETGLAEWRRRYGGRQRECVVCLEEYEDGISQVMSLPCGHEFHADCITPWLVTRRRTCPICKGDVVRSLSQSYHDRMRSSSPIRSAQAPDNVDDIQTQAIETRNDSPSASQPVPISTSAPAAYSDDVHDDVEANWSGDDTQAPPQDIPGSRVAELSSSVRDLSSTVSTVVWRGFEAVWNTTGLQRRVPPEDVDRDR
ncbi:hypothetical protein P153DRAFT_355010 [Dothidotthia symphoricarpi CBS 119687]|uniref:RING-type domain-containing protein n=1 Tax=Dothidotthia symphoricarpi CBS 119687 TaxID=1392245 RepID=A0A6A6AKB7_9PLEO|nr:uncharacterized protein P153DRAFT_355010 [Dothidotthia symphoricarpi CBS 119687]KAF2132402.1 hypothetical protein P153DRAFT_355010 [Dothidotthia symphoricarpi CBS 119687]